MHLENRKEYVAIDEKMFLRAKTKVHFYSNIFSVNKLLSRITVSFQWPEHICFVENDPFGYEYNTLKNVGQ